MEKSGSRSLIIPVGDAPPYSRIPDSSNKSPSATYKVLGLCLVSLLLVLALVVVAYVTTHPSTRGDVAGTTLQGENFELNFNCEGRHRKETVSVSEDGNMVRIVDTDDGVEVFLDYIQGIAIIKNPSLSEVYLTRIENIPEPAGVDGSHIRPIVMSDENEPQNSTEGIEVVSLQRSNPVPDEYMDLLYSSMVECRGYDAYWLEELPGTRSPVKRGARGEDGDIIIIHVIIVRRPA